MKKALLLTFAVLLALSLAVPAAAFDYVYPELGGKVDVLDGEIAVLNAPNKDFAPDSDDRLTDGIICKPLESSMYFNKSWIGSVAEATEAENAGNATCEFTMTDGTVKKYYYEWDFEGLDCDVSSFSIWWSNEKDYSVPESVVAVWQADAAFDILVSQDGGQTWSVAWESTRLTWTTDAEGNKTVDKMSAFTVEQGGDWTHVEKATDTEYYWYRYISADFNKEYTGVTNIAYGCVNARRESATPVFTNNPFYYIARITEFDVYGTNHKAVETEPETQAPETQAPDTQAPETKAPGTQAPDTQAHETQAPATQAPATEAPKEEKKGCGSFAALLPVLAAAAAGAAVFRRKRK
jgi:cell division septation protein DedD